MSSKSKTILIAASIGFVVGLGRGLYHPFTLQGVWVESIDAPFFGLCILAAQLFFTVFVWSLGSVAEKLMFLAFPILMCGQAALVSWAVLRARASPSRPVAWLLPVAVVVVLIGVNIWSLEFGFPACFP